MTGKENHYLKGLKDIFKENERNTNAFKSNRKHYLKARKRRRKAQLFKQASENSNSMINMDYTKIKVNTYTG